MRTKVFIKGKEYLSIWGEPLGVFLKYDTKFISGQATPKFSKEGCICRKFVLV